MEAESFRGSCRGRTERVAMKKPLYWDWIESEAALINTDGCSKVSGVYRRCCLQHDLAYYYARDPVSAYRVSWDNAIPTTKGEADVAFRRCMQSQSRFGFFSPIALYRWLGVKLAGKKAWNSHRQREQQAEEDE